MLHTQNQGTPVPAASAVSEGAKQFNQNKATTAITEGIAFAIKGLSEALDDYGASGLIAKLLEQESEYALLLSDIQNGVGNIERPETEDAAEVLKKIRGVAAMNAKEYNSRMFLLQSVANLITAADSVCFQFKSREQ